MKPVVAALLLLGVLRHYSWELFDPEIQAQVWNAVGSMVIVTFLLATVSRATLLVVIWWIAEEAQTILCSIGWIFQPWQVKPGEAQCSALLGFDLSSAGLLAVSLILVCQHVRSYRSQKKENQT
jgi:hypothetical protein